MEKPVKAILNGIIVGAIIAFLAMVLYAIPLFNNRW
jgi:gas vesicle protein